MLASDNTFLTCSYKGRLLLLHLPCCVFWLILLNAGDAKDSSSLLSVPISNNFKTYSLMRLFTKHILHITDAMKYWGYSCEGNRPLEILDPRLYMLRALKFVSGPRLPCELQIPTVNCLLPYFHLAASQASHTMVPNTIPTFTSKPGPPAMSLISANSTSDTVSHLVSQAKNLSSSQSLPFTHLPHSPSFISSVHLPTHLPPGHLPPAHHVLLSQTTASLTHSSPRLYSSTQQPQHLSPTPPSNGAGKEPRPCPEPPARSRTTTLSFSGPSGHTELVHLQSPLPLHPTSSHALCPLLQEMLFPAGRPVIWPVRSHHSGCGLEGHRRLRSLTAHHITL